MKRKAPEEVEATTSPGRVERRSPLLRQAAYLLEVQRAAGNRVTTQLATDSHGASLPPALQAGIERLSGVPVDDVTVHLRSAEPAKVHALGFARDGVIHLAPGQEGHLAHEAWHVVQQRQGRVRETGRVRGLPLNDDRRLEAEADRMGERAQRIPPDCYPIVSRRPRGSATSPSQLVGVTLQFVQAAVERVFGGTTWTPTVNNKQLSSLDRPYENNKNVKFHVSIGVADPGSVHLSYYPAAAATYPAPKIMQYAYTWNPVSNSFGPASVTRQPEWKKFSGELAAFAQHADGQMRAIGGEIIRALAPQPPPPPTQSAPIPIPSTGPVQSPDATHQHTPEGGWPRTPPGPSAPVSQFLHGIVREDVGDETYVYSPDLDESFGLPLGHGRALGEVIEFDVENDVAVGHSIRASAPPANLARKKVDEVKKGRFGAFQWKTHWELDAPSRTGGFVIQDIVMIESIDGGAATIFEYQEAWEVEKGARMTASYASERRAWLAEVAALEVREDEVESDDEVEVTELPYDDEFASDEHKAGTSGWSIIKGTARFHDGLVRPASFVRNNSETLADDLPSRRGIKLDDLGPGTAANSVTLRVDWDTSGETVANIT